jgi:hypothetical protein
VTRTNGFVVSVTETDLLRLDRYEGVPYNYRRTPIDAVLSDGKRVAAVAYLSTSEEHNLPSEAYIESVAETISTFWRAADGGPVLVSNIPIR